MEKVAIGIDIGGTNIEIGIVDKAGGLKFSFRWKTKEFETVNKLVLRLKTSIESLLIEYDWKIIGIGIGAPTANFYTGAIEFAPNLPWQGIVPLQKMIYEATEIPTKLTNDANAVAHGELFFGAGRTKNHFVVVTLGTGLGSGIVVDRKVLYGHHGLAGEFGHVQVESQGRLCNCGRKGCLETYVSIRGIEQTYKELGGTRDLNPRDIYILAQQGDKIAFETYQYTAKILGNKLADFVHLFDPEAIFLYGGVANAYPLLIPEAQKEMDKNLLEAFVGKVKILPSELLDKKGAILGAAALIWQDESND